MAQPIGASVSDNGVTLTVDAVLGDANSYAILYTLSRDDGTPLLQNVDPDANLYNTHFDEGWTITDPDSIELQEGEGLTFTGNNLLYTAFRPTDNAIHFFEEWHCPTLENMSLHLSAHRSDLPRRDQRSADGDDRRTPHFSAVALRYVCL